MNQAERKNKRWVGYIFYVFFLTIALLYYLFPAEAFEDYIKMRVRKINPMLDLSLERLSISFPPGILLEDAELNLKEEKDIRIVKTERFSIRPKMLSLIRKHPEFLLDSSISKGDVKGTVIFTRGLSEDSFETSMILTNISMGNDAILPAITSDRLEGSLSGKVGFNRNNELAVEGQGTADLTISDGSFRLLRPVLGVDSIDFNTVSLKISFDPKHLNFSVIELKGRSMKGTASGTIYVNRDLPQSRINIKGTIEPFADLFKNQPNSGDSLKAFRKISKGGKLSFRIEGTILEPKILFM